MTKQEILAAMADTAFSGLVILQYAFGINDKAQVAYMIEGNLGRARWYKVYYATRKGAYIVRHHRRYYLADFSHYGN